MVSFNSICIYFSIIKENITVVDAVKLFRGNSRFPEQLRNGKIVCSDARTCTKCLKMIFASKVGLL